MNQTFTFQNGEVSFETEKIIIKDEAIRQRRKYILISVSWIVFGFFSVLHYYQNGEAFFLWTGLLIGIGHFIRMIIGIFRYTASEIQKEEIHSIKISQQSGKKNLDIKLKGNRLRRVYQIDSIFEELQHFLETDFKTR